MKKKFTNQKGITLIALIITIIVMLILVAVTISVAINGGLFERAKNATEQTQIEADREELLSAVVGTMNHNTENVVLEDLKKELGTKWQITGNGPYTVTSPKGNMFIVATNGNITTEKNTSVAGTYNAYMANGITSIVLNDDSTTGKIYVGINEMPCTYEYDEKNNKIIINMGGQLAEVNYVAIGSNKILYSPANLTAFGIFTTNGEKGITPLAGTYKNQDDSKTFTFTTTGVFNESGVIDEGIYCLINSVVYIKEEGATYSYEINNDYTQIELPDYTLYLQQ